MPTLREEPGPLGDAARATEPLAALAALGPVDPLSGPAARYLAGRALLDLGLPMLATRVLALPPDDPLAPAAVTLLVDRRGSRPIPLVLEGVDEPTGPVPTRVREALRLRDGLAAVAGPAWPDADLAAGRRVLSATRTDFTLQTSFVSAVLLARSAEGRPGNALNLAASALDADRERVAITYGYLLFAATRYDEAARWFDRIGRRSPRWQEAQLAAVQADAMAHDLNRAFARLRPLLDPRVRARRWRPGEKGPAMDDSDFEPPPETAPIAVQEAWAQEGRTKIGRAHV